jgi:hypothetical protein
VSVFENREDVGSGLFCSELAAAFYQRLGLLPRYPASNTYIPMDFATAPRPPLGKAIAGLRREGVELLQGAYLGEEVVLKRGGRMVRVGAADTAVDAEQDGKGKGKGDGAGEGRTAAEEGAETQQLIARALGRYGPTSGLVGAAASPSSSSPSSSSASSSAAAAAAAADASDVDGGGGVGLPEAVLSRFHKVSYRAGQLIDAFSPSLSPKNKGEGKVGSGGGGGEGGRLYVIAEGEVELYRQWPQEQQEQQPHPPPDQGGAHTSHMPSPSPPAPAPELVATLGPGQAFGGAGFGAAAGTGVTAAATIGAGGGSVLVAKARRNRGGEGGKGPVKLWRAAGDGSMLLLGGEPPTRPRTRAERARVLSVLTHHPYFQGIGGNSGSGSRGKEAALGRFFAVHVRKGEAIVAQGERGDNLYILDSGNAEIVRRKGPPGAAPVVVAAAVNPGAVFGEAAVLFDSRRGASVRALEDCRLWALGRMDAVALTGRGPPFTLLEWFQQHASVVVAAGGKGEELEERYMTYDDFYRALYPPEIHRHQPQRQPPTTTSSSTSSPSPSPSPPPIRLLLRALDPTCVHACVRACLCAHWPFFPFLSPSSRYPLPHPLHTHTPSTDRGRGLISFSEVVHLDVWMNSQHSALEAALRLAGRDAGFEALTLADWAALRDAARRDLGDTGGEKDGEEEAEADARFVARTFGARQWHGRRRGRGLLSVLGGGGGGKAGAEGRGEEQESLALSVSVPYDDFARALQSPGECGGGVRWRGVRGGVLCVLETSLPPKPNPPETSHARHGTTRQAARLRCGGTWIRCRRRCRICGRGGLGRWRARVSCCAGPPPWCGGRTGPWPGGEEGQGRGRRGRRGRGIRICWRWWCQGAWRGRRRGWRWRPWSGPRSSSRPRPVSPR